MHALSRCFLTATLSVALMLLCFTPAAYAETPPLYDGFSDPQWDGSFNQALWFHSGDMGVVPRQSGGVLTFSGATSAASSYTDLVAARPEQRTLRQVQRIEGRFLADDPQGEWSSLSLQVQSWEINGHTWWTTVGFSVHPSAPEGSIFCAMSTYTPQQGAQNEWFENPGSVTLGEWHTLALVVDLNTARFQCEVDGQVLAEHTPADAAALLVAANLSARIVVGQATPQSTAKRWVDDVRLPSVVQDAYFIHLPLLVR